VKTRVLINTGGGSVSDRPAIVQALHSAGIDAELEWVDGGDFAKAASTAVAGGAELIVAGGGDGTLSAVAGALAGTETKLGILPLGTLNHFARDLGIPAKLDEAARLILEGREHRVDVGEVNGRVFINNSAIGIYPLMVTDRDSQQKQRGRHKRVAMAIAAARTLFRFSSRRLTLTIDEQSTHVETPLLFVGNNAYRLEMPGAGTRERIDRGELCVVVLRRNSRLGFVAATIRVLFGRRRHLDVERVDDVHELRVDVRRSFVTVSVDGETERLASPLTYRIRPKALRVVAP
jgi:YegS/Rv2252/BmrU family lipid kinase